MATLDLIDPSELYSKFLTTNFLEAPFNDHFHRAGIEGSNIFTNLGLELLFAVIFFLIAFFTLVLQKLTSIENKVV